MSNLKLLIFLSSVRPQRNADRVLKFVSKLAVTKGFIIDVIDPIKENLPMLQTPLHYFPDQTQAPQQLHDINQKIISADAYLMITAEYNFGVPPALLNIVDHFPPTSFSFKPAGIISYSAGQGGCYSSSHLEHTLTCVGCLVQPFIVNIQTVENTLSADGNSNTSVIEENTKILLDQIEFNGVALKIQKQSGLLKQPRLNEFF